MLTSCRFCDVTTVTIFVGQNKKPFQIHLNQLCEVSTFFKAAFTRDFKEKAEKKMDLPEEDEVLFDHFVRWLYSQHYEALPFSGDGAHLNFSIHMFVLADQYGIGSLKKPILESLFAAAAGPWEAKTTKPPTPQMIVYGYEHTTPKSGLRKLLADWYSCQLDEGWVGNPINQEWLRTYPDIAADLVVGLVNNTTRPLPKSPFKVKTVQHYLEIEEPSYGYQRPSK